MKPPEWLTPWLAPAAVVAIFGLFLTSFNGRFTSIEAQYADTGKRLTELDTKLDRRADALLQSIRETNTRIDGVLQNQTALAAQVARVEGELSYIRGRLDKVADKLQVSSADTVIPKPADTIPVAAMDGVLTREQFDKLYSEIKTQSEPAFSSAVLLVGQKVPTEVPVKPLPASVAGIRPSWTALSYTVGKTGLAIVNPTDKSVLTLVTFAPEMKLQ